MAFRTPFQYGVPLVEMSDRELATVEDVFNKILEQQSKEG